MNARSLTEPAFEAPWQAQLFAMKEALQDAGMITSDSWAQVLGRRIALEQTNDSAEGYWRCWANALEDVLAAQGIAQAEEVRAKAAAWQRAAAATPHGAPIELANDPRAERRQDGTHGKLA